MNHTIKGIIVVAVMISMLVVGASMVPIMQNSFAHKKSDFKRAERDPNTNTNTNSADSISSSTATAENTNNIDNSASSNQAQSHSACSVAVTCPEGSTTATLGLGSGAISNPAIANPPLPPAQCPHPPYSSFVPGTGCQDSATQTICNPSTIGGQTARPTDGTCTASLPAGTTGRPLAAFTSECSNTVVNGQRAVLSGNARTGFTCTFPKPTPQTGTLLVANDVTCPQGFTCPQPSDFTMHVTGNNPNPSSFAGSSSGTTITLNPGNYNVAEDIPATPIQLKLVQHFSADCSGSITTPGESKSCNVVNEYRQQQYVFLRQWGSFGTGDGQFENVVGIAINPSNKVYASDSNGDPSPGSHHRIQEFTSQGEFITKWGSAGNGNGQFIDPFGIAFDSSGNVYVADQVNQRIQKFTSDGTFIKSWGISVNPTGIAVDSHDNVYVTVQFSHFIAKFTADGTFIKSWGTQGTGNGQFEYPRGIAIDSSDNVYVTDLIPNTLTYRVQKFTSDGVFITSWGSLGGGGSTSLQFNGYGIAIDNSNNVYVADTFSNRIQKFTSTGIFITEFGSPGSGNGQFNTPHDLALDSSGNVYIADTENHRIQVFALDP